MSEWHWRHRYTPEIIGIVSSSFQPCQLCILDEIQRKLQLLLKAFQVANFSHNTRTFRVIRNLSSHAIFLSN